MYKIQKNGEKGVLIGKTSPVLLALLPSMEGRRKWIGGSLHFEATEHNIRLLTSSLGAKIEGESASAFEPHAPRQLRPAATRKTEPFEHQKRALEHFGDKSVMALFMEQGTGKTKTVIDWADDLYAANEIDAILVVTRRGVHRQWALSELPRHMSSPFSVNYWGEKGDPLPSTNGLSIITINWDGAKTKRGWEWVERFLSRHKGRVLIIADEAQDMKNHTSQRHKMMKSAKGYSSHRAVLTGTPIAKDLTDEWAILGWLDEKILGVKYVTTFRAQYCIMGGFQNKSVVGHKQIDQFRKLTAPFVFRVRKEDIGLLPKQRDEWTFSLTKDQRSMIQHAKMGAKVKWDAGEVKTDSAAQMLLKIQQITNGFIVDDDGLVHRLMPVDKNPRIIAAQEWVGASDSKAIIWCRFREDVKMLTESLAESHVIYVGGLKAADQQAAVDSFLSPEGAQVMIATDAASTGLNLQGLCNRALYYSEGFNAVNRWQKEDRIDRIGTVGFTIHTDLIAVGGIDRSIMRNRAKKKGISDLAIEGLNGESTPDQAYLGVERPESMEILLSFLTQPDEGPADP